jgi:hypothetical protein
MSISCTTPQAARGGHQRAKDRVRRAPSLSQEASGDATAAHTLAQSAGSRDDRRGALCAIPYKRFDPTIGIC